MRARTKPNEVPLLVGEFVHYDWTTVPFTTQRGETGSAFSQTLYAGDYRIRKVRYSANYSTDHWCNQGHIVLVLSGQIITRLRDGRSFVLEKGQMYVTSGDEMHRSSSAGGAELF